MKDLVKCIDLRRREGPEGVLERDAYRLFPEPKNGSNILERNT